MNIPTFLAVGHVVRDVDNDGYHLGGPAAYAAVTAARLGERAAIVTRGVLGDVEELQQEVDLHVVPASKTTTFCNLYQEGKRYQRVLAVAEPLTLEHVPPAWRETRVVLLAPVVREVDPRMVDAFPQALVGASLQGWLRQWDETGAVRFHPWEEASQVLSRVQVAVLSEEDVEGDEGILESFAHMAELLAVTRGGQGVRLHYNGKWFSVPAFPAMEVNPTGAGDAHAAAFLIAWRQTHDLLQAARFANATGSLVVEGEGLFQLPTRKQVEARLSVRG